MVVGLFCCVRSIVVCCFAFAVLVALFVLCGLLVLFVHVVVFVVAYRVVFVRCFAIVVVGVGVVGGCCCRCFLMLL